MNINDAIKAIGAGGGIKLNIPSLKYAPLFKRVNTGIQKMMGTIAINSEDQYYSGMMRLAMFDELLLENTHEYKSSMLTTIDMIAFMAQLKLQVSDEIKMSTVCKKCGHQQTVSINLKKLIENCSNHEFKEYAINVEGGEPFHKYEFVLKEPSYMDDLILSEGIRKSKINLADTITEAQFYYIYSKLCLYVSKVVLDGNEINGDEKSQFNKIPIQDRLKFFDTIDQKITINEKNQSSILSIIVSKFSESKSMKEIFDDVISPKICQNSHCDCNLEGELSYDNFFEL